VSQLTREDVERIKEMLEKFEQFKLAHVFTAEQGEAIRRIIQTFDSYGEEIQAIIEREQASVLMAKLRLKYWSIVRWFLAAFVAIVAAMQSWDWIVLKWWQK
jgi:hypothetical protein